MVARDELFFGDYRSPFSYIHAKTVEHPTQEHGTPVGWRGREGEELGVGGTPSFVVGGKVFSGSDPSAQPLAALGL